MSKKEIDTLEFTELGIDPVYYDRLLSLKPSVRVQVIELIEQIELLRNIVSKDRKKAHQLEQDSLGRIINIIETPEEDGKLAYIDFTMHELEDMDYFTERAMYYQTHGKYTHLYPNRHPSSEFMLFWTEEARRCKEGYIRKSDGEWISGYYYWYLNYSPILQTSDILDELGNITGRAERIYDFPKIWDSDYMFYHYVEKAESKGLFGDVLKTRGRGYSFKCASMLDRNFYHYPKSKSYALAAEGEYLTSDGIINKAWDVMDWVDEFTPWRKSRHKKDTMDHKKASYVDPETGVEKGYKSEIMAVTLKNNPEKARGKRGKLLLFEESGIFPGLLKAWAIARPSLEDGASTFGFMVAFGTGGCLTKNNKVWTANGNLVPINELNPSDGIIGYDEKNKVISKETISYWQKPKYKECVELTTNTGRTIECSLDHPLYTTKCTKDSKPNKFFFKEALNFEINDKLVIADEVNIWGNKKMWNPRMIGLLIGDGSYGKNQSVSLANCDEEIINYAKTNFKTSGNPLYKTKLNKDYYELGILGIRSELKKLGILNQVKNNKTLPLDFYLYQKEDIAELLGGFYDADGYVSIRKNNKRNTWIGEISLSSSSKNLLNEVRFALQKFGIHGTIRIRNPRFKKIGIQNVNTWFEFNISDQRSLIRFTENITLIVKEKQERLLKINKVFSKIKPHSIDKGVRLEKIVKIKKIGLQQVYNLTADNTNTYLGNGIITHNTEGAAFEGAEELFYNPKGYRILAVRNIFDKIRGKGVCAFFVPEYMNRKNCYDHNGNSDVIEALSQVIEGRENIRLNTSDPNTLTQEKADRPITPQESVMRKEGTLFPVGDLKDYLADISPNLQSFLSPHYIGRLTVDTETGLVDYKPDADVKIIREFPIKDNLNKEGGIEIYELPKKDFKGEVPRFRYIAGIDPYDDDFSTTNSLGSMFVMDVLTDRLACEYTGRPNMANIFYENCLRILKFYNGIANYENDKKGLFSYFSNRNGLSYLADNPQILKDMEMTKVQNAYGNKAKGTNSGQKINAWGRRLQADWMLSKAYGDENLMNLHKIRSIGYLKEAINWNPDGNFDRISSLGMLLILREEYYKYILHMKSNDNQKVVGDSHADDPFFEKNWKKNNVEDLLKSYKKPVDNVKTVQVKNGRFEINR